MNEERTTDYPKDEELHSGEGNGYTSRAPGWRDAEFLPSPRRRGLLERIMNSRPVRDIREYAQAERRPVPTWVPGAIITISILLITQFGMFAYWKGGADRDLADVRALRIEVARLRGQVGNSDELYNYVQMLFAYEVNLREKLLPVAERYGVKYPPMPTAPPRRRAVESHQFNDEEEQP